MVIVTFTSNVEIRGGYRSFLVQSGSMEPTIGIGDIIVIQKKSVYRKNDVITFRGEENRIVTHRIIEEKEVNTKSKEDRTMFITKGDANRSEDEGFITFKDILGQVVFSIPKLGYLVTFSKSIPGLITLILIPATLLVLGELLGTKNAKHG
jgi:signal peptidase